MIPVFDDLLRCFFYLLTIKGTSILDLDKIDLRLIFGNQDKIRRIA
jgi:hypothetical protein